MPQWTDEQREAIEKRDKRMLVAAAAGSGKTAVLVERIIRRISDPGDPVDVDRLLVVTFTNGAAAEMRERIGAAVAAALDRQPGATHLSRQPALLQRAGISTIHSFCLDVIRQYYYRLELDPVFRVMDETEAALLQSDVLEEALEHRYAAGDAGFLQLVDCYGGSKDDGGVQELVLEAHKLSRSTPDPDAWLRGLPGAFDVPAGAAVDHLPWFGILATSFRNQIAAARGLAELAVGLSRRPGGPAPYLGALENDLTLLDELAGACDADWQELYIRCKELAFSRLARCSKEEADEKLVQAVKKMRDYMKNKLKGLQKRYFHRPPAELVKDLRGLAPVAETLAGLTLDFAAGYRRAKLERGVVDFSDLEHYALEILSGGAGEDGAFRPSQAALELRGRYVEVLVDEYQDINAVQETILNMLAGDPEGEGGPGLFMVGDVKQSIYRFRLAEPGLFLAKYNLFAGAGPEAGRLVDLARNFRSRSGVVEAVNHLFSLIMTPAVGEMEYDARAALVYGADFPPLPDDGGDAVELYLVDRTPAQEAADIEEAASADGEEETVEGPAETGEDLDAMQVEARTVARRIIELVESGHPVFHRDGGYRRVKYRDMVVLMRATAGRANTFVEEFGKLGVPAHAQLTTGYFEAVEVETMLALLKIIDNPRQDVSLAAALRSPAAGFSSDELAAIRLGCGGGTFYDAVVGASRAGTGELSGRLADFLRTLDRWRTLARQGDLPGLIWTLYRETGYYDFVGGLPGGSQRQANLRALYHRARQFESTVYRGLFRFLRFIERLRDGEGDMGAARALGENENVVRVMSIHKSKGLEFPVVFVAGLGKRFNITGLNRNVLLHRDLGLGPQLVDPVKRVTHPTVAKLAVREKLRAEELAEEMRLLYVAMTRAKEKLILVGSVAGLKTAATRWCGALDTAGPRLPVWMTAQAVTCLDWIGPTLAGHPGGAPLRRLAGLEEKLPVSGREHGSRWLVRVLDGKGLEKEAAPEARDTYRELVRHFKPVPLIGPRVDQVTARLNWSYPHRGLQGLAARATVTDLKEAGGAAGVEHRRPGLVEYAAVKPAFVQRREGLDAAGRGQALHLVMQLLDLEGDLSALGVKAQMAAMAEREQLAPEQVRCVIPEAVAGFFSSPLGRRVLAGRRVFREQPFTLALPVKTLYPDTESGAASGETVLVQGIIDCLVEEEAGLLVVDYKTDRYTPDTMVQLAERYRHQLQLYSRAVKMIAGRPVTAMYLYLFHKGDIVSVAE
ncbi:MAG: helicase-exonuclease AddAB subunit AddA [Firmicutes bacterium]|nr:helicase-exonuclease AddAB subunit AddA [Bacillota bacterium]